jgi:hypothetical protein
LRLIVVFACLVLSSCHLWFLSGGVLVFAACGASAVLEKRKERSHAEIAKKDKKCEKG